jgi:hypothetical protein
MQVHGAVGWCMAIRLPSEDPIGFLVFRKFPDAEKAWRQTISYDPAKPHGGLLGDHLQAAEYAAELARKDPAELQELYEAELAKHEQELATLQEAGLPWNQPSARADFEHWSKASYWSLEEAVALSFGRSPVQVGWETMKLYTHISPFARAYEQKRDLVLRAKGVQQLYEPVIPTFFLAWAKRIGIEVDKDLVAAVEARGEQIADWKTRFDELEGNFNRLLGVANDFRETASTQIEKLQGMVATLTEERDQLLRRLEEANRDRSSRDEQKEKVLGTRERETLLRLIIAMAVDGYGYKPGSGRSGVTADITSALDHCGLHLDADTVRKWLKEAAELLPEGEAEPRA